MKKSELEAEIRRLTKSAGWYSGQYYRLKELEGIDRQALEASEAEVEALEAALRNASIVQDKKQRQATKERKARQKELLKERLAVAPEVARPRLIADDEDVRLERCQAENTRLRKQVQALKAKLETQGVSTT